jgi:hypothetical protein
MIYLAVARQKDRLYRAYLVQVEDGPAACTAHDVKSYAARIIGADDLAVYPTGDDARPDCGLRWTGSDAGARGASPDCRRLEVRECVWKRGKRTDGEWRRA